MSLVVSTEAKATITSIDATKALGMPGVVDFICHRHVPGANRWGTIFTDEEIFATNKVCMLTFYYIISK